MKNEIITHKEPKSPISEIFRNLRTNVQFANSKRGLRSLLITSTSPGEGKSWVSSNLAVAFAQAGKKVILIDCDMRKGRQFSIFNLPPTPGLSNYLSGINSDGDESSSNILSYIKETEVKNLYIITAGNIPPNPSELLTSTKMINLIKMLEGMADIVIFDSTPSTMVTDAMAISRYVGSTIIVASHKKTKMEVLKQIKRNIENVGGKVSGVVLNRVPLNKREYGKSYYYESSIVTSTVKPKKFKLGFKESGSKIFGGTANKVEDSKVEQMKQKLDKVDEEKSNQTTNDPNNNDEDLNMLLKQLTKYLETK